MTDYRNISTFRGLNSLRFFAAFLVVMHHAETIRNKNGLANLDFLGLFKNGSNAVSFFFVLSGFLITYLLLKERAKTNDVSIKKFYMKRILRIWPLYYLLFVFGTLLMPMMFSVMNINYEMPYAIGNVWYYFVFFTPGLATFFYGHHLLEPLWSIGVEEVFYLIWAPLFKFIKRNVLPLLLSVIAAKVIVLAIALFVSGDELFVYIATTFRFETLALGGLGAYYVYHRKLPIEESPLFGRHVRIIMYLLIAVYLCFHINIDNPIWNIVFQTPIVSTMLVDALYLYVILSVSLVETKVPILYSKFFNYLGDLSYGVYMYHMPVIFGIMLVLKNTLGGMNAFTAFVVFYSVLTVAVIAVAATSKKFYENYFLRIKARKTGN